MRQSKETANAKYARSPLSGLRSVVPTSWHDDSYRNEVVYTEEQMSLRDLLPLFWSDIDPAVLNNRSYIPTYYGVGDSTPRQTPFYKGNERISAFYQSLGTNNVLGLTDEDYLAGLKSKRWYRRTVNKTPTEIFTSLIPLTTYHPKLEEMGERFGGIDTNVATFFALMAASQRLEHPETKAPITNLDDLTTYLDSLEEPISLLPLEQGVMSLVSKDVVRLIIQQGIIIEEDLDIFFGQVVTWKEQIYNKGKTSKYIPLFPQLNLEDQSPYDFRFLPHLCTADLIHLASTAELGQFDARIFITTRDNFYDLAAKTIRQSIIDGLGIETSLGKNDQELLRELHQKDPKLAQKIQQVYTQLAGMRGLFGKLLNYYRSNPSTLGIKDSTPSVEVPNSLAEIREEILQHGARNTSSPQYFRTKFATRHGQV